MSVCDFIIELNRLRKSSSESIDSTNKFDEFKEYIHVERTAERDLKVILKKVNATGKKTLFMLCGSAGDGKSHLMSYLKNSEPEKLIENYQVYNDATKLLNTPKFMANMRFCPDSSHFSSENLSNNSFNVSFGFLHCELTSVASL